MADETSEEPADNPNVVDTADDVAGSCFRVVLSALIFLVSILIFFGMIALTP